eukprot:g3642.t1
MIGLMTGLAPITGLLMDRAGRCLPVVFAIGGFLISGGLLLASISESLVVTAFTFSMAGLGLSLCGPNSATIVQSWFDKRRGIATGLAMAGSGIGNFVLPPILEALVQHYGLGVKGAGWRETLRIEAAIIGAIVIPASMFLRRPKTDRKQPSEPSKVPGGGGGGGGGGDGGDGGGGGGSNGGSGGTRRQQRRPQPPVCSLLRTRAMASLLAFKFIGAFGYANPFIHIAAFARDQGIEPTQATLVLAMLGVGSVVGRVLLGLTADRFKRHRVLQISIGVMGVACFGWPWARDLASVCVFAFIYGFNAGGFVSLPPTITADLFGARYPKLIGLLVGFSFCADTCGCLLGPPIFGWIYDAGYTDYIFSAFLTGSFLVAGSLCLFAFPPKAVHEAQLDRLEARVKRRTAGAAAAEAEMTATAPAAGGGGSGAADAGSGGAGGGGGSSAESKEKAQGGDGHQDAVVEAGDAVARPGGAQAPVIEDQDDRGQSATAVVVATADDDDAATTVTAGISPSSVQIEEPVLETNDTGGAVVLAVADSELQV